MRANLTLGDRELSRRCTIMRLRQEAEKLGLKISDDDYTVILLAFCVNSANSEDYDDLVNIMGRIDANQSNRPLSLDDSLEKLNLTLNYEKVLNNMVPVVTKQSDLENHPDVGKGISIGWTVTKQAKIKAMRI